MNIYMQRENQVIVATIPAQVTDYEKCGFVRISRARYREIKRAQRESWERVNNADNDGRPFKDAGR